MSRPYLVQRCTYRGFDATLPIERKTITATYNPDYMGSSEFEFGALPASLIRMGKGIQKYCIATVDVCGKTVYTVCPTDSVEEYKAYLEILAKEKYGNLKEVIHFADYYDEASLKDKAEQEKRYQKRFKNPNYKIDWEDVWWDVENDVVWSFNKEAIDNWVYALEASLTKMGKKDEKEIWDALGRSFKEMLDRKANA